MNSLIKNLLTLSRSIRCRYPDHLYNETVNEITFNSNKTIMSYLSDENTISDCGSVLWCIILQYYYNDKISDEIDNVFNIPNPKFHIYLPRTEIEYGNIYYLEYTPFYLLKEKYVDTGKMQFKTNNMGWWILHLGKIKDYITEYNDFWLGDAFHQEDECYLYFIGNREDSELKMAISPIEFIKEKLVSGAINDWENTLIEKSVFAQTYSGIFNILLKINNISNTKTKMYKTGSILLDLDDSSELEISDRMQMTYCKMLTTAGHNYMNNSSKLHSY